MDHPNVLKLYSSFVSTDDLWMVTPLMVYGSTLDIMRDTHPTGFNEECIGVILNGVLNALVYLHGKGTLHRDIKAGNVFISQDGVPVLGDFGVAADLIEGEIITNAFFLSLSHSPSLILSFLSISIDGEAATGRRTFAGTPCWMAPEVMMQKNSYSTAADMWSFGITAIELAKGRAPHSDLHAMKVVMKVMSSTPPNLDEGEDKKKFSSKVMLSIFFFF